MNFVRLGDVADVCVSGVDKKTMPGEQAVRLCNYTDVYYNWTIRKELSQSFMMASARDGEIAKFRLRAGQVALTKDSETRDDIGHPAYIADDFEDVILGYHCALISPHVGILDGQYLNGLLRTRHISDYLSRNAGGSGQRYYLSDSTIKALPISLPPIDTQLRIAGVLGSLDEKIALNRKKIAELEALAKLVYEQFVARKQYAQTTIGAEMQVVTGKRDSNFATKNGRYRFFTCSKEKLMCDEYEFEGKSVLLSGNGDLHVKFYDGRFNAYQRTYVLKPRNEALFAPTYFAVQATLKRLTSGAAGSIVKFITKGDVERISIPVFTDEISNLMNDQFENILTTEAATEELIKLRDELLPLLMNGQVVVK